MPLTRLVLVGGFLGAGKTTTIGQLARVYTGMGRRVGIITNDQATNLVDTQTLRQQGYEVREVPDSCFCCAFPALIDSAAQLSATRPPDVILGEPVGSCTDLAATVVQPLKRLHADRFLVTPLLVLIDPHRAREILETEHRGGFSSRVAYIYEKQLEEADVIAVNKIDALAQGELDALTRLVAGRFPQATIVPISARTGEGLEDLVKVLDGQISSGRHLAEVDYDIYADGEAELGWFNGSLTLSGRHPFDLDAVLLDFVRRLDSALRQVRSEVAHLKVIALAEGCEAVANLIRGGGHAELSRPSGLRTDRADLIVNARVVADPADLEQILRREVARAAAEAGLEVAWGFSRSLRPGRPVPTHRFAEAV